MNIFIFGLIIVIVGNIAGFIISNLYLKVELPHECKNWNKYYVMELTLFVTGIVSYYISTKLPKIRLS